MKSMRIKLIIAQANIVKSLHRTMPDYLRGELAGLMYALMFEGFNRDTAEAAIANSEFC
jgi:hypothetical protein